MQSSAMVLARSDMKCFMWTAVTALWRLENIKRLEGSDSDSRMIDMLPRLAEGLAKRIISDRQSATADDWKVFIESQIVQGKHLEAIEVLEDYSPPSKKDQEQTRKFETEDGSGDPSYMSGKARLELLASLAQQAGDYERGLKWYEDLLRDFIDDWTYGSNMLKCADKLDTDSSLRVNVDRCSKTLNELQKESPPAKPVRGPYLLDLEMISMRLRCLPTENFGNKGDSDLLKQNIVKYIDVFGGSASCCFSDVRPYVTLLLQKVEDKETVALEFLNIFKSVREDNKLLDGKNGDLSNSDRGKKLRNYIVACQVSLEVWSKASQCYQIALEEDLLPDVECIIRQWEQSLILYKDCTTGEGNQVRLL